MCCCRRKRALIVGHVGFDYFIDENDLEYSPEVFDRLVTKEDFQNYVNNNELVPFLGGTAGNVSAVMRKIGALETDLFSCGDEEGLKTYNLKGSKPGSDINIYMTPNDPQLCVPICLIISENEQQKIKIYDPTLKVYNDIQSFNLIKEGSKREYELLHVTTLPPNAARRIIQETHEKSPKTTISFCPGQNLKMYEPETLFEILKFVNILFVNDNEMEILSEWTVQYGEYFKEFPDILVHTRGSEPTTISTKEGVFRIPTIKPIKLIDTTGAGDAYAAAFLSSYMVYEDPIRAAKFAATVASFIIEEVGCQTNIPDWHQRRERCKTWKNPKFA